MQLGSVNSVNAMKHEELFKGLNLGNAGENPYEIELDD